MSEVVLSVFDPRVGPHPVYSTIEDSAAKKVALKSQLTLSMSTSATLEESTDAVIPFPELGKTGYIFLFKIPSEDKIASLSFLMNDDRNMELYKNIPFLRFEAKELTNRLLHNLDLTTKDVFSLSSDLMDRIKQWGQSLDKTSITIEEELVKRKITIKPGSVEPSISFLFDITKNEKDLAKVITAILKDQTVFLICSNTQIREILVASLERFAPHKVLRKITYTENPVSPEDADLIVIDPRLQKFYRDYLVLNLDNKKISKAKPSQFVLDILNQIKGKSNDAAIQIIEQKVNWLLGMVSEITELFVQGDPRNGNKSAEKKALIDKVSVEAPEALDIIVEIAASVNPLIKHVIRKEITQWKEKSLDFFKQGW